MMSTARTIGRGHLRLSLRSVAVTLLLLVTGLGGTGCVGFSGPNDVRMAICAAEPVDLEKEHAVSVGPVAILLAGALAGSHLPFSLDGLSWVDFGEYTIHELSAAAESGVWLSNLELDGWERIVRIREPSSEVLVLVGDEDKLKRLLVLTREGDTLVIVRVRGNLEKVLARALEHGGFFDLGLLEEGDASEEGEATPGHQAPQEMPDETMPDEGGIDLVVMRTSG